MGSLSKYYCLGSIPDPLNLKGSERKKASNWHGGIFFLNPHILMCLLPQLRTIALTFKILLQTGIYACVCEHIGIKL